MAVYRMTETEKVCKRCNKPLSGNRKTFCSDFCCTKYYTERRSKKRSLPWNKNTCLICKEEFTPTSRRNQKYCSPLCVKKAWKIRNPEVARQWHKRFKFDGNWQKALQRDKKCVLCKSAIRLEAHHKDNRGTKCEILPNHALDNLLTLCRNCHREITKIRWYYKDGKLFIKSKAFEILGLSNEMIIDASLFKMEVKHGCL